MNCRRPSYSAACGGLLLSFVACAPAGSVTFEPCTLPGYSGIASCTRIEVPEDHDDAQGNKLTIHVARIRASGVRTHDAPLVLLAGGPGQAASQLAPWVDTVFKDVLQNRDVLLIDQRGTGQSHPMKCAVDVAYRSLTESNIIRDTRECLKSLTERPEFFGTESVIRDLNLIRQRLGLDRLVLWGASFGTRTALRFAMRFPDAVESMIIDGVTSNTESLFLRASQYSQAAFETLVQRCAASKTCDHEVLQTSFRALTQITSQEVSLEDPIDGQQTQVEINGTIVASTVRSALYGPDQTALLPLALDRASKGDHRILAAISAHTSVWAADTMSVGATLSILCSEDVDRISPQQAAAGGKGRPFGELYYRFWSTGCQGWPRTRVPQDYGELTDKSIPVLALSGGLDPVTPPASAEVALAHLPRAQHLVAPNVGHNVTPHGCAPQRIAEFIEAPQQQVDGRCLADIEAPPLTTPAMKDPS